MSRAELRLAEALEAGDQFIIALRKAGQDGDAEIVEKVVRRVQNTLDTARNSSASPMNSPSPSSESPISPMKDRSQSPTRRRTKAEMEKDVAREELRREREAKAAALRQKELNELDRARKSLYEKKHEDDYARKELQRDKIRAEYDAEDVAAVIEELMPRETLPELAPDDPKAEMRRARAEMQAEKDRARMLLEARSTGKPVPKVDPKEEAAKAAREQTEKKAAREELRRVKEQQVAEFKRKEMLKEKEKEMAEQATLKREKLKQQFSREDIEKTYQELGSPKRSGPRARLTEDEELSAARAAIQRERQGSTQARRTALSKVFTAMDIDGDGFLDSCELHLIKKQLGLDCDAGISGDKVCTEEEFVDFFDSVMTTNPSEFNSEVVRFREVAARARR